MRWILIGAFALLMGCSVAVPIQMHEPAKYNLPTARLRVV